MSVSDCQWDISSRLFFHTGEIVVLVVVLQYVNVHDHRGFVYPPVFI